MTSTTPTARPPGACLGLRVPAPRGMSAASRASHGSQNRMDAGGRGRKWTIASLLLRMPRTPVGRLRHHLHHLHHPLRAVGGGGGARRSRSLARPPGEAGAGGAVGAGRRRAAARRAVSGTSLNQEGGARGGAGGAGRSPPAAPHQADPRLRSALVRPRLRLNRLWSSRPRDPGPSYVAPVAGAVAAPRLSPWFQVGAFEALFGAAPRPARTLGRRMRQRK